MVRSRRFTATLRCAVALGLSAVSAPALAIFQNGGFEQGGFASWTLGGGYNPGLAGAPPFTGASVQINAGAAGPASVVGAIVDPHAPTLVLPRVGANSAKLNDEGGGALVTSLQQVDTLTSADIDPHDGKAHIRFAFAPVLEDPSHSAEQQPYFYVSVKNLADNSVLFEQFAYSGQPGVNFLPGDGNWKYLEFQDVDAVLPASALGQQIELTVIAADCSLGAHGGYVYIDGFGSAAVPPQGGGGGPAASTTPVPTLGGWALMLMASLLAFCGWRFAPRRS